MPAFSRSQNGVASLAYVAGIHVLSTEKVVDGRNKSGHDESFDNRINLTAVVIKQKVNK